MATRVLGWALILKADINGTNKIFGATSANTFSIKPEFKESIVKEDQGVKKKVFAGYTWGISASGLTQINETGDETNLIDRQEMINAVKAGTQFNLVYGPTGSGLSVETGLGVIVDFKEDTDAEEAGKWSIEIGSNSNLTTSTNP